MAQSSAYTRAIPFSCDGKYNPCVNKKLMSPVQRDRSSRAILRPASGWSQSNAMASASLHSFWTRSTGMPVPGGCASPYSTTLDGWFAAPEMTSCGLVWNCRAGSQKGSPSRATFPSRPCLQRLSKPYRSASYRIIPGSGEGGSANGRLVARAKAEQLRDPKAMVAVVTRDCGVADRARS